MKFVINKDIINFFLISQFKKLVNDEGNIYDIAPIIKIKYPVGVCLVKKAIPKIIGNTSQYIFEFVFKAKIKQKMAIIEKKED